MKKGVVEKFKEWREVRQLMKHLRKEVNKKSWAKKVSPGVLRWARQAGGL